MTGDVIYRILLQYDSLVTYTRSKMDRWTLSPNTHTFFMHIHKIPKATIKFVMSVQLFVSKEQLGSHWMTFHEI